MLGAANNFGGIGVTVAQMYDQEIPDHLGELVVLALQEKSPAAAAGLQPADIIIEIDGVATKGKKFEILVTEYLRGIGGSRIKLKVSRQPSNKILEFEIRRIDIED